MTAAYNSKNIKVYSDIEAVRKHPHMYVGDNEEFAIYLIVREILANAVDEVVRYGNIAVIARTEKGFIIYDDGRGIPVDAAAHKIPAIKLIFEKLNSGGKSEGQYGNATIGVHGVGCVVSNALSHRLIAASYREKKWHIYSALKGHGEIAKIPVKSIPGYDYISHHIKPRGSLVYLEPDLEFFGTRIEIDEEALKRELFISSVANPKKKYIYIDIDGNEITYHNEASKYGKECLKISTDTTTLILKPEAGELNSYVCAAITPEHGTHWQGFLKAYGKAIEPYVKKNQTFDIQDALQGFSGILNYSTTAPSFSGQAKQKLKSKKATSEVEQSVLIPLTAWVKKHSKIVKENIENAVKIKNLETRLQQERSLEKTVSTGKSLPYNLTSCPYAKPKDREIYLLEGLSAASTAIKARDEKYQEVMPIDGKILNVYRSPAKSLKSETIQDILRSIGYSKADEGLHKARVQNKIVILTDIDADGPLRADTVVKTDQGNLFIKQIYDNFHKGKKIHVLGYNEDTYHASESTWAFVNGAVRVKVYEYYKVTLNDEHIISMNESHRQCVYGEDSRLDYYRACDLQVGMEIPTCSFDKNIVDLKITEIKKITLDSPEYFYCLSTSTGNFYISDKNGNGLLTGNCHIRILILSMLWKFVPQAFYRGMVYYADTPLYSYEDKTKNISWVGDTLTDLKKEAERRKIKFDANCVNRAKGWAGVSPQHLRQIAFDPKTRKLVKVPPLTKEDEKDFFGIVQSIDATYRARILGLPLDAMTEQTEDGDFID